jgi:hypothetical protein
MGQFEKVVANRFPSKFLISADNNPVGVWRKYPGDLSLGYSPVGTAENASRLYETRYSYDLSQR